MMSWKLTLLFMLGTFLPMALVWGVMKARNSQIRQRGARPAFGNGLLRHAGQSVRMELEDVSFDLIETVFSAGLAGLTMMVFYLLLQDENASWPLVVVVLVWVAVLVAITLKILGLLPLVRNLRLGWEGEVATAEELNRLMLDGWQVFHDVPAESHNIDHIVVGVGGIFAVETHVRFKPQHEADKEAIVVCRGERLHFAGGEDNGPLQQAQKHAQWLSQWLSVAEGQPVAVTPALALPGWFVKTEFPGPVLVFSPKLARSTILKNRRATPFSNEQVKSIAARIEQHCRAVKPQFLQQQAR